MTSFSETEWHFCDAITDILLLFFRVSPVRGGDISSDSFCFSHTSYQSGESCLPMPYSDLTVEEDPRINSGFELTVRTSHFAKRFCKIEKICEAEI